MNITELNKNLSLGNIESSELFSHVNRLSSHKFIFEIEFGLEKLPTEPGILLIRGPRQYGKSTWLELEIIKTIKQFGAGTAFYLNGDFIPGSRDLEQELINLAAAFTKDTKIKRIFIDEITNIDKWELVLKRLVDNGTLAEILIVTTGSKATDLRRGAERLPGRKGRLDRTDYLFTPVSYKSFHAKCHKKLKEKTLIAYLISGGSPIACLEIATNGYIPNYVIQLVRDWIEGEIAKTGRHRSALLNIFQTLFKFGSSSIGQAKLAREAGLANNTVAQNYIEILSDLGCVVSAYPIDLNNKNLILRKPCKYHYINLLVAVAYHPAQIRSVDDFLKMPEQQQGMWFEWLVAQELQRRRALNGSFMLEPMGFWQSDSNEIDFYEPDLGFVEVKKGKCTPLEFAWFNKLSVSEKLIVINKNKFETNKVHGIKIEDFLIQ